MPLQDGVQFVVVGNITFFKVSIKTKYFKKFLKDVMGYYLWQLTNLSHKLLNMYYSVTKKNTTKQ